MLSLGQFQVGRQRLVPTQRMQFTLDVLTISEMELQARIHAALQENLLVEPEDIGRETDATDEFATAFSGVEYREGLPEPNVGRRRARRPSNRDGEDLAAVERLSAPVGLGAHLRQQVGELRIGEVERAALEWLIGNLDDRGYLEGSLEDLAAAGGFDLAVLRFAHGQLLQLSPAGCGARHLGECLAAQARQRWGARASELVTVLTDAPRSLARPALLRRLARSVGLESEADLLSALGRFHRAPGLQHAVETPERPVADVAFVACDGGWVVHLPDNPLDQWRVRTEYVTGELAGSATWRFIRPWLRQLRMWRQAVRLRRETLRQLCEWLVAEQPEFVAGGPRYLKPVTMTQAAQALGLSVSTISRCVQNKRLHFVWGSFWFREIFREVRVGRIGAESGDMADLPSWLDRFLDREVPSGPSPVVNETLIRERLEALLATEHAGCVYSDEVLAERLREGGLAISRRCLTRYRQKWGIGTRGERLRMYRMRQRVAPETGGKFLETEDWQVPALPPVAASVESSRSGLPVAAPADGWWNRSLESAPRMFHRPGHPGWVEACLPVQPGVGI